SDDGPKFITAEFQAFANNWEFKTLNVIAVSFAIERKSRIGSQDREEYSEEIGRPFESGVGVAKHANVSNQFQSSAAANAKTHAGVSALSGAIDETR
ncbi:hypothetical protein LSAT2_007499, partial [Lamellibrachia satsuma]